MKKIENFRYESNLTSNCSWSGVSVFKNGRVLELFSELEQQYLWTIFRTKILKTDGDGFCAYFITNKI